MYSPKLSPGIWWCCEGGMAILDDTKRLIKKSGNPDLEILKETRFLEAIIVPPIWKDCRIHEVLLEPGLG
jgi:hypothetical protein